MLNNFPNGINVLYLYSKKKKARENEMTQCFFLCVIWKSTPWRDPNKPLSQQKIGGGGDISHFTFSLSSSSTFFSVFVASNNKKKIILYYIYIYFSRNKIDFTSNLQV